MNTYYRLDRRIPVQCGLEKWLDGSERLLIETVVSDRVVVATIFRSINPEPGAFFDTVRIEDSRRHVVASASTWDEAMQNHQEAAKP